MNNMHKITKCNACLNCILKCPTSAISLQIKEEKIRIDRFKCITCKVCKETCPIEAIEFVETDISKEQFLDFKCRINKKRIERFSSIIKF